MVLTRCGMVGKWREGDHYGGICILTAVTPVLDHDDPGLSRSQAVRDRHVVGRSQTERDRRERGGRDRAGSTASRSVLLGLVRKAQVHHLPLRLDGGAGLLDGLVQGTPG